jgi:hypothetical protein
MVGDELCFGNQVLVFEGFVVVESVDWNDDTLENRVIYRGRKR